MTDQDRTRQRILAAATDVFTAKGYQRASTREICRRAGANIAAVHYHFGDKAELYREVFRKPLSDFGAKSAASIASGKDAKQALTAFYRYMLEPFSSMQKSCQLFRLHAREQLEPSGVLGDIRPQAFRPRHDQLMSLLCAEFKLQRPDIEVKRLALALEGQTLVYWHGCELVQTFAPELFRSKNWIEELSVRLADFGVAMIEGERRRRAARKKRRP
jgi:AcrR family transcriptional regulator